MRAVTVSSWGATPEFSSSCRDPATSSEEESVTLKVLASGLHQLVRLQATGTHYTNLNKPLPYIPGADGVGLTPTGEEVYFNSILTGGAFAESITVPKKGLTPIPEGADPVVIAGLANPGMSSWMAFAGRVDPPLREDFTLVIMGATAISAKVAISFAQAREPGKSSAWPGTRRNSTPSRTLTNESLSPITPQTRISHLYGMSI